MRKPGPATYLFGNPVIVLAAIGATAFFGYQWWSNNGSPSPAVIAFLIACQSMHASDQLQKFNEWKREWEAMEGKAPGAGQMRLAWTPALRFAVGVPAWCFGAYMMSTVPIGDDPAAKLAVASFWLGSVLGFWTLIYRSFQRNKPAKEKATTPDPRIVVVCVAAPHNSPTIASARNALPNYCMALLQELGLSTPHQS